MYFTRDGRFVRTDIWREGKYLDLWSVPHFLSGMSVGFALYLFRFEPAAACIIAFLLFVAYEMFEVIAEIEETRWNRTLDVVVGMISFIPTFLLAPRFEMGVLVYACVVVVAVDGVLSYFGWKASKKAAVLEARFRAEFIKEQQKMRARKSALRESLQSRRRRWHERQNERRMRRADKPTENE